MDSFLAGLIHGVTNAGAKMLDEESATIGKLKGKAIIFQGQSNGQTFTLLSYVVFTDHEVYLVNFYCKTGMTKTDPFVTSYLSRSRLTPTVVPGDVNKPADGWDFSSGRHLVLTWFDIRGGDMCSMFSDSKQTGGRRKCQRWMKPGFPDS